MFSKSTLNFPPYFHEGFGTAENDWLVEDSGRIVDFSLRFCQIQCNNNVAKNVMVDMYRMQCF